MKVNNAYALWKANSTVDNYEALGRALLQYIPRQVTNNFKRRCNEEELQDIEGNTYIKVFKNLETFKGESTFATWVASIIENEGRELLRFEAKNAAVPVLERDAMADPRPAIEAKIMVEQLAKNLTHPERVLLQGKLEGVSEEELAIDLKIPIGTIKSRWNTLKAQLRTQAGGE